MKKLLFVLLMGTKSVLWSQTHWGVKAGANFANLTPNTQVDNQVRVGFHAGLFAKITLSELLALEPEIYYTTKGAKLTYHDDFARGSVQFKLDYVEIPVLLVVDLTHHFNAQVGPYVSYLIRSEIKNTEVKNFDYENTINPKHLNLLDAGIILGVAVGIESFEFGFRFNLGLITVGQEKNYSGQQYTFPDAQNGVINLYLSYPLL